MPFHIRYGEQGEGLRSCFDLFEMFFEVKKSSSSSRFFSQIVPLSSLEEAVEPEVFHSQIFKQTNQNSFLFFDAKDENFVLIRRYARQN